MRTTRHCRRPVTGDPDDARPLGPESRLAQFRAPDLEFRKVVVLESFDQHEVAVLHPVEQIVQRRLAIRA